MTIGKTAVTRIASLSQGLPHYTHLFGQHAAQSALDAGRAARRRPPRQPRRHPRDRASQQSIVDTYQEAADGRPAALPASDARMGPRGGGRVRLLPPRPTSANPLSRIPHKPCKTSTFARHLEPVEPGLRGTILQRSGGAGTARYRFVNPLLQPYVAMRGIPEGVVRASDLQPGK